MQNGHALTQDICQNLKMGLLPGAFSLMWGAAFGAIIGVKRDAPLLPQRADIKSPTPPHTAPALSGRVVLIAPAPRVRARVETMLAARLHHAVPRPHHT